jgi:hypothetical protein
MNSDPGFDCYHCCHLAEFLAKLPKRDLQKVLIAEQNGGRKITKFGKMAEKGQKIFLQLFYHNFLVEKRKIYIISEPNFV